MSLINLGNYKQLSGLNNASLYHNSIINIGRFLYIVYFFIYIRKKKKNENNRTVFGDRKNSKNQESASQEIKQSSIVYSRKYQCVYNVHLAFLSHNLETNQVFKKHGKMYCIVAVYTKVGNMSYVFSKSRVTHREHRTTG